MMSQRIKKSLFLYENLGDYLSDYFKGSKTVNPLFSMRGFARAIGLQSPSMLSMIISGSRIPSSALLVTMGNRLGWSDLEFAYAELIVARQRIKGGNWPQSLDRGIESIRREALGGSLDPSQTADMLSKFVRDLENAMQLEGNGIEGERVRVRLEISLLTEQAEYSKDSQKDVHK